MQTAEIKLDGKTIQLPVVTGTENEKAIDIARLREQTGYTTLDCGVKNTAIMQSAVTFMDGENGMLRYRGYSIEQLAEKSTFLEVTYLLIYGELPSKEQLNAFTKAITHHTLINEDMKKLYDGFPYKANPISMLISMVNALSAFYPESLSMKPEEEEMNLTIQRLLAKAATLAAWAYKKSVGHSLIYPRNNLNYSANLLNMMFTEPSETYLVNAVHTAALDKLLILYADHEQNSSTYAMLTTDCSHSNLYAAIAAAITALWGMRQAGDSPQGVLTMLETIFNNGGDTNYNIKNWKEKLKSSVIHRPLLKGIGHPIYKNYDPRARILKNHCDKMLNELNSDDPLLSIAKKLEEQILADSYFAENKLYPNLEFYAAILFRALEIPPAMFTVLNAIGRMPGWIAHWKETTERQEPISRPRQIYIGKPKRDYVGIAERSKIKEEELVL